MSSRAVFLITELPLRWQGLCYSSFRKILLANSRKQFPPNQHCKHVFHRLSSQFSFSESGIPRLHVACWVIGRQVRQRMLLVVLSLSSSWGGSGSTRDQLWKCCRCRQPLWIGLARFWKVEIRKIWGVVLGAPWLWQLDKVLDVICTFYLAETRAHK